MTELCPRSCCWLTAAGFFLLIGSVQMTSGFILLRSKYVFLLAGPNFWTAAGNIITGCLLGVASSVWKKPRRKRISSKHVTRENMIAALLISSAILNATTAAILILGEGNTMLSIDVETMKDDALLAKEILRIAYVTSVVCPVVCLVVAGVAFTEECCRSKSETSVLKTPLKTHSNKSYLKRSPKRYGWVFDAEKYTTEDSTLKNPQRRESSLSSSGCDDVTEMSRVEISSSATKYPAQSTPTVEDLQKSLSQMSHSRILGHLREDSLDLSSKSPPLAGEMVAIQIRAELHSPENGVPVDQPITSRSVMQSKSVVDAAPTRVRIKPEDLCVKLQRNKMSSFKAVQKENPKHSSPMKNQRICKSPAMDSIIEAPSSEQVSSRVSPSMTSGYESSPELTMSPLTEGTSVQTVQKPFIVPVNMITPRKAPTETIPKELYVKTRSSALSKPKSEHNVVEIFDPYSLVGLNNLEIIATHCRNRAFLTYLQRKMSGT